MSLGRYVLEGQTPVLEPDLMKWADRFVTTDRVVRQDTATVRLDGDAVGNIEVSTVFLGVDHQFGRGRPLLFETMVFGGPLDQEWDRCSTWEAAEKMHEAMMERVKLATKEQCS